MLLALLLFQALTPYQQACSDRGFAVNPPKSPSQHYLFQGTQTTFLKKEKSVVQSLQLAIGGPDLLRKSVGTPLGKKTTLLHASKKSWVKTPQGTKLQLEELPQEEWIKNEIRWILLRYPWGWALDPHKPLTYPGKMKLTVILGENGLPSNLRWPNGNLQLSDWKKKGDGELYPFSWKWSSPKKTVQEDFLLLEPHVLFLEQGFRPPSSNAPMRRVLRRQKKGPTEETIDRIGLVMQPTRYTLQSDWDALPIPTPPGERWLLYKKIGEKIIVWVPNMKNEELPPGISTHGSTEDVLHLSWTTFQKISPKEALERLKETAKRSGLRIQGPLWASLPKDGETAFAFEFLLPVTDS
jgi:hypothetical protein